MIRLYTDAAVNGNPGSAGIGLLILINNEQIQLSIPLSGEWNNHLAEFKALYEGIKWLIDHNYKGHLVFCYTDSQIVAQSVENAYVKDPSFGKYLRKISKLMKQYQFISVSWISEEKNRGADNLAKQALQKAISSNS